MAPRLERLDPRNTAPSRRHHADGDLPRLPRPPVQHQARNPRALHHLLRPTTQHPAQQSPLAAHGARIDTVRVETLRLWKSQSGMRIRPHWDWFMAEWTTAPHGR